ncbi:MAG TPA: glycosyltransferase, partial [Solirubrobacteraceae bacterium]|nr:glycosyltransferase [Solirubrobacteraceae bacterium]
FATQGDEHLDAQRLRELLARVDCELLPFDHAHKLASALGLLRRIARTRPSLVVMEGTGLAGGIVLLLARLLLGVPYVVSSGDAVAPYLNRRARLAGIIGAVYERMLCRHCAGFIGWTPYLVGRALTYGAPRAITAAGWARESASPDARERIRAQLGVGPDTILVGIVGSLRWNASVGYTYGLELVRAAKLISRHDVAVCVIGDGDGRERLLELAADELDGRVLLPGRVPPEAVADHLAAFDLASLPQSVDGVGSFRYSTKLSEYLAAGLPIVTGQIPAAYDLDRGFIWRLPGEEPWSETYVNALASLLSSLTREQIAARAAAAAHASPVEFDRDLQQTRAAAFVADLLADRE